MASRKSLRKRLSAKEVPFLVTLLVGWAGWAVGHIVDRVVTSPTVEYTVETSRMGDENVTTVSLVNLSNQAFYGLRFEIQGREMVPCKDALQNTPPAWPWNGGAKKGTDGVTFDVVQLHPGWRIAMCAKSVSEPKPKFYLRDSRSDGDKSGQSIQLVEPSLETFFVRHELSLMILLALVAFLTASLWLALSESVD
jgi:hypothetical protein